MTRLNIEHCDKIENDHLLLKSLESNTVFRTLDSDDVWITVDMKGCTDNDAILKFTQNKLGYCPYSVPAVCLSDDGRLEFLDGYLPVYIASQASLIINQWTAAPELPL